MLAISAVYIFICSCNFGMFSRNITANYDVDCIVLAYTRKADYIASRAI